MIFAITRRHFSRSDELSETDDLRLVRIRGTVDGGNVKISQTFSLQTFVQHVTTRLKRVSLPPLLC